MSRKWSIWIAAILVAIILIVATAVLALIREWSSIVTLWVGAATVFASVAIPHLVNRGRLEREAFKDCHFYVGGRLPRVDHVLNPAVVGVRPPFPSYVKRETDKDLLDILKGEEISGGEGRRFILLVADSTAGKTRSAFEALKNAVPDHVLIAPRDQANLEPIIGRALRMRRCVLWLDSIEKFLRSDGLRPDDVEQLLGDASKSHFIVGTIGKSEFESRTIDESAIESSSYSSSPLLSAHVIHMDKSFTQEERERAKLVKDPVIQDALRNSNDLIPSYIAGAPVLLARWKNARTDSSNQRGAALVSAAVDCRYAGLLQPLPRILIEEVNEIYLHGVPEDSPGGAWEWAKENKGSSALLTPASEEQSGEETFSVPDFLVDQRNETSIPDKTLKACLGYANDTEAARIGRTAYRYGRYEIARSAYELAIRIRSETLGHDDPGTLASRDNLARALRSLGELSHAENVQRAVIDARRDVIVKAERDSQSVNALAALRRDNLTSRDNLGRILRARGDLEKAEQIHREVYENRLAGRLSRNDHDVVTTRMYLAQVSCGRGHHAAALEEFRKIVDIRTQELKAINPDVLIARSYFANDLRHLGRPREAEQEHRDVIRIRTQVLGPEHPDTLISRSDLAQALFDQGMHSEASDENMAVYMLRVKVLGEDHPYTVESRNRIADRPWSGGAGVQSAGNQAPMHVARDAYAAGRDQTIFLPSPNNGGSGKGPTGTGSR